MNPGESVILTEATAAEFRSVWNLSGSVDVIGNNTHQPRPCTTRSISTTPPASWSTASPTATRRHPGSIRAQNTSGNPLSLDVLGTNNALGVDLRIGRRHVRLVHVDLNNVDVGNPGTVRLARCCCRPPRGCCCPVSPVSPACAAAAPEAPSHLEEITHEDSFFACVGRAAGPALAGAQVASLDLGNYQLTRTVGLPAGPASEASAVTWNWDSDTLFVVGDEGDAIVEVDRNGAAQLHVVERLRRHRRRHLHRRRPLRHRRGALAGCLRADVQRPAAPCLVAASLRFDSVRRLATSASKAFRNDPSTGQYIVVKEKTPQQVNAATLNFGTGTSGTANVTSLFDPASLGLTDLSDVQVLSTVLDPSSADYGNLLIYSQESARLLEVSRTGTVLSMYSLAGITGSAEGVTIDRNGTIYIVDEKPEHVHPHADAGARCRPPRGCYYRASPAWPVSPVARNNIRIDSVR